MSGQVVGQVVGQASLVVGQVTGGGQVTTGGQVTEGGQVVSVDLGVVVTSVVGGSLGPLLTSMTAH